MTNLDSILIIKARVRATYTLTTYCRYCYNFQLVKNQCKEFQISTQKKNPTETPVCRDLKDRQTADIMRMWHSEIDDAYFVGRFPVVVGKSTLVNHHKMYRPNTFSRKKDFH